MRVAVLGLGEAGSRLAADLADEGVEVAGYDPALASESTADAASAVAESDIVLSVNSAAVAVDVAGTAAPALRSDAVYADLNTGGPGLKRELAEVRRERDEILAALRELQAAVQARWQAEAELAALYREREIARARAVERDQNAMLN